MFSYDLIKETSKCLLLLTQSVLIDLQSNEVRKETFSRSLVHTYRGYRSSDCTVKQPKIITDALVLTRAIYGRPM